MEIGQKLRQARLDSGLTQEAVAERVGVSRQTVSNWENNRSYPDIASVITLSDLYSLTLDELLKGDVAMIRHLEESTDVVRSREKLSRLLVVLTYLIIWALSILVFWMGFKEEAMLYSIATFYLVLPLSTLILAGLVGRKECWTGLRWVMLLFFGFLYMLAPYATFNLANMLAVDRFYLPNLATLLPGLLCAAAGMGIGCGLRRLKRQRQPQSPQD